MEAIMKTTELFKVFILLSVCCTFLFSSDIPDIEEAELTQVGGYYIPEDGTISALLIYVQFPDDDYVDNNPWPINSFPSYPLDDGYLSEPGETYQARSISHYYYEMSSHTFNVVGMVYPELVITPHTKVWYDQNNYDYGDINLEVLAMLDDYIDYSDYDNITVSSGYNWSRNPDGIVDMIFIRYRCLDENDPYDGFGLKGICIASLGYNPIGSTNNRFLTDDGVYIKFGFPGSGVTNHYGFRGEALTWSTRLEVHEFGHYLFGAGHHGSFGGNGLMQDPPGWNNNVGMHAWERERLGYLTFTDVTSNTQATISDQLTTGVAYRMFLPGGVGNTGECFVVENRQQASIYDRPHSSGIIISHLKGQYYTKSHIDIECADGRWDWIVTDDGGTPGYKDDDLIAKSTPNPQSGYDGLDYIYIGGLKYSAGAPWYPDTPELHGDAYDTYCMNGNTLFAPYTNPSSMTWDDGYFTNMSIELIQKANNNYVVYFDYDANPQTPQNFSGTWYNNHPKVYWTANTEPDFKEYEVWKKRDSGSWYLRYQGTNTYYIDYSEFKWNKPQPSSALYYKVCAVDNADQKSEFTSEITFIVNAPQQSKDIIGGMTVSLDPVPSDYQLHPAFPNPFNASTTLKLDLPEKTTFSLIIYDIKGSEVWSLNNRHTNTYSAGYHTIVWDGTDNNGSILPTGLYLMVFNSPDYRMNQKLVLVK